MKAYYFTLQVPNVDAALAKGKAEIEAHKGTLIGNEVSGKFSIPAPLFSHIVGSYGVQGNIITVNITNSPDLARGDNLNRMLLRPTCIRLSDSLPSETV